MIPIQVYAAAIARTSAPDRAAQLQEFRDRLAEIARKIEALIEARKC